MATDICDIQQAPQFAAAWYALPATVYANDPCFIPTPIQKLQAEVDAPDFHGRQRLLLAVLDGTPVARCLVRWRDDLVGIEHRAGLIGSFEALDDPASVRLLMDAACEWLATQQATVAIGPMDGDTWHKYRFNLGPWERPPFMLEPYNAPYYPRLWEAASFTTLATYYSKFVPDAAAARDNLARFRDRCLRHGFSFRPLDLDRLDEELPILYDLSCRIFEQNYLYTPIPYDAFARLYADARPILRRDLAFFCLDANGSYAGFAFCTPDYAEALRRMGGRRSLLGKLAFLRYRGKADTLNIKTIGTLPEHRRTGLGPALMCEAFDRGLRAGFRQANMCLIHEENASGRLDGGQGDGMRTYALYHRETTG